MSSVRVIIELMYSLAALEKLGLSEPEAAVLLLLTRSGPSRAPQLQTALGLKKVAVYRALSSLTARSLVSSSGDRRLQIYTAEPLQRLLDQYDQNIHQMHRARADLEKVISGLAKQDNKLYKERKIQLFDGVEGLRLWYNERLRGDVTIIRELGPLCPALFLPASAEAGPADKNLALEVTRKRLKKKIEILCLFTERKKDVPVFARTRKDYLRETRILETLHMPDVCLSLFGTRLGFYSSNGGEMRGMIVDDPMLAGSIALIFDMLWQQSKAI